MPSAHHEGKDTRPELVVYGILKRYVAVLFSFFEVFAVYTTKSDSQVFAEHCKKLQIVIWKGLKK